MSRTKMPTKLEIKRARVKRKKGWALLRESGKVLNKVRRDRHRRRFARRRPDEPTETFHTWQHDFSVLLPAVVRSAGSEGLTPEEVVTRTALAADQMRDTVASRRPRGVDTLVGRRDGRRGPMRDWFRWQSTFDGFVHDMCDRATMSAFEIVDRAVALADLSISEIERRRPGKRKVVS